MAPPTPPELSRRGFLRGSAVIAAGPAVVGTALAESASSTAAAGGDIDVRPIDVVVDRRQHRLAVHIDDSAATVLRENLGCTGLKVSCGEGVCGSCTALIDGEPQNTCTMAASCLDGRVVTTIHSHDAEHQHPVQRAFAAEDALQCGFCTPGFVMQAIHFWDGWRAAHGASEPPAAAVQQALAGHLCRCGAYPEITRAVQRACRGDFDDTMVAVASQRVDAWEKVHGTARYTVDQRPPGTLFGVIVRSRVANGVLDAVDLSAARAVPGFRAAHPLLDDGGTVRFAGQPVVAIAADTLREAEAAARKVVVRIRAAIPVLTRADALSENAPLLYPKAPRKPESAAEGLVMPGSWRGNLRGPVDLLSQRAGAVDGGLRRCREEGVVAEGTFVAQCQSHCALEPHAALAQWEGKDRLLVYASTQAVAEMREDIAARFDLRHDNVRVLAPYVGGGFGAKSELSVEIVAAVELARLTAAPVLVAFDRAEELAVAGLRPGAEMRGAIGAEADGSMGALDLEAWNLAGAAVGQNVGLFARLLYPGAPKRIVDWDVVTHAPPGKAMRGPGGPAGYFALESLVDEVAHRRGEDSITLRRRWDRHEARHLLYDHMERLPIWSQRARGETGRFRRGTGLAIASWFYLVHTSAQAEMQFVDGHFVVRSAAQDIGNGTRTLMAEAAAATLGVPRDRVRVDLGDSDAVRGCRAGGSRTAASLGPATEDAARRLIDEALSWAKAEALEGATWSAGDLVAGGVRVPPERWSQGAGDVRVIGRRRRDKGGWFMPFLVDGLAIGRGLGTAVVMTEVEVDTRLGRIRPLQVAIGVGCGKIRVPTIARTQVSGAVIQGLGYALYERRVLDPRTGITLTRGLDDYRIPGIGDTPPIDVIFEERGQPVAQDGVGLSEVVCVPVPASVANAVFAASGRRPTTLPIRLDDVAGSPA